jgi:hypothetical protein
VIHHVVLFRFAAGVAADQIHAAGAALLALQGTIPEIRSIAFGPNLAESRIDYSHALLVAVEDMTAVERYLAHPEHVRVVKEHLAPIREARLAVDFEVPAA